MDKKYVIALDQGTTSCRAIVFDRAGNVAASAQREFTQHFPEAGWVEHDAEEIWQVQLSVMKEAAGRVAIGEIAAIGITNQRETTIIWDRTTGQPLHRAIVWQCRRTANICDELKSDGFEAAIRAKTGLVLDPYFSGTKLKWLLDRSPELRNKAAAGDILFGTIDSWLIWKLTDGGAHVTDYTNASRTLLYNIHQLDWDDDILRKLDIPRAMLPDVRPSSDIYGFTGVLGDAPIPISGVAGDQQAALFGQACTEEGMAKNTYGTGCFILTQTGDKPVASERGLLTTIAWGLNGKVQYALEGSVFVGGAVVQWLRDGLGIITDAAETEPLAESVPDTAGVCFVPAFTGLGTPYWNAQARGMITGLTRGATKAHIVRAALESIALQSADVLRVMEQESGTRLRELRVDGGATANAFLMQFQADVLGVNVTRSKVKETTALGAAYLAGLAVGFWSGLDELRRHWASDRIFVPEHDTEYRSAKIVEWQKAVGYQL